MKKMIALGMAAAMMCMSLTACSVSTSSKTETTAAAETTAADTTAEAAKDAESTAEAAGDLVATADYPTKPITMIIPYGAGGTTDTWGRKLAVLLEKYLGQPITVTNQGGASGSIGSQFVKEQPSDGYTLLVCAETMGTYRTMNICDLGMEVTRHIIGKGQISFLILQDSITCSIAQALCPSHGAAPVSLIGLYP